MYMDIIGIGQFIVAAGSLAVAYSVARSDKQIKELVNLTMEQKRQSDALIAQNEILIRGLGLSHESLQLQKKLSLSSIRPFFSLVNETDSPSVARLYFRNGGTMAIKISVSNYSAGDHFSVTTGYNNAKSNEAIEVIVNVPNSQWEGIEFDLNYRGEKGDSYSQRVKKILGDQFAIDAVE